MCHHGVVWSFEHFDKEYSEVEGDGKKLPKVGTCGFDNTLARKGRKILVYCVISATQNLTK